LLRKSRKSARKEGEERALIDPEEKKGGHPGEQDLRTPKHGTPSGDSGGLGGERGGRELLRGGGGEVTSTRSMIVGRTSGGQDDNPASYEPLSILK